MVMVTVAVPVRAGVPGTPWSDACPHGNIIRHNISPKLQALVYDILPSTTALFSYAIESRKLSANEQFFLLVLKQW